MRTNVQAGVELDSLKIPTAPFGNHWFPVHARTAGIGESVMAEKNCAACECALDTISVAIDGSAIGVCRQECAQNLRPTDGQP